MNNTCWFGPDIKGNFVDKVVMSEVADACNKEFCICDTHDFEAPNTFESVLAARLIAAKDRTRKPGDGEYFDPNDLPVVIDKDPLDPAFNDIIGNDGGTQIIVPQ